MISLIHLSKSFLEDITKLNFNENNSALIFFLKQLYDDDSVYFVGKKNILEEIIKNNLNNLKKINFQKNYQTLYFISKKTEWLEMDLSINDYNIDFYFTGNNDAINNINYYTTKKIIDNFSIILKKIEKNNSEIFDIKLKKGKNYYLYDNNEIENFKKKFSKVLNISNKIIIWDQYIPDNLARIDKKTKQLGYGTFSDDYIDTLKFFENEIFNKLNKKIFCEILTMNKLEADWNYKNLNLEKIFLKLAQNYINQLKKTSSKLLIKNYNLDSWDMLHSRVIVFKDEFNQLICYCVFEPGADFVKKKHKSHYKRSYRVRNYKFTPGNRTNYGLMNSNIQALSNLDGSELSNTTNN
tara:strand:- start:924 stop:1982 length:1059 start_codon:yes stop_codon:yes gene_type:complete